MTQSVVVMRRRGPAEVVAKAKRRSPAIGSPPGSRRSTRRWHQLAAQFKAECRRRDLPCHLCGQPIDYDAAPQASSAFEADHLKPVSTHPHLEMDRSNLAPAHVRCNRTRGANPVATQREWVRPSW